MKCSDARELFSAKVDDELAPVLLSQLDTHLANCAECQPAWVKFQSTVSLLHGLPLESTHPAFVGQVLDRIRGYEAEGRQVLEPMDGMSRFPQWAWIGRLRERMALSILRPVPAMALGSLVVGIGVGSWVNHLASGVSDGAIDDTEVPNRTNRLDPLVPARPFGDLTDEIGARHVEAPSAGTVRFYSPNWGGGGDWVGQQQVRYENDGARIIF